MIENNGTEEIYMSYNKNGYQIGRILPEEGTLEEIEVPRALNSLAYMETKGIILACHTVFFPEFYSDNTLSIISTSNDTFEVQSLTIPQNCPYVPGYYLRKWISLVPSYSQ